MVTVATLEAPGVVALALRYPTEDGMVALHSSVASLQRDGAEREMRRFLRGIDGLTFGELEELYTATFDLTPMVAPYVGHLAWADSYERGGFMAEIQGAMRNVGVDPEGELPDHLEPILRYLAATDEPVGILQPVLVPAITKMEKILKNADAKNPYVHVLAAARIVAEERMR